MGIANHLFCIKRRPQRPEKFENAVFISSVRPTVHTNPSRKRFSNRRNLKTPAFRFSVDGKHFQTELFGNDDATIIM